MLSQLTVLVSGSQQLRKPFMILLLFMMLPSLLLCSYGDSIRLYTVSRYTDAALGGGYVGYYLRGGPSLLNPDGSGDVRDGARAKKGRLMVAVPPMGPEQQHLFAESSFEVVDPTGAKKEGELLCYGDEVVLVDDQKMVWNNAQGEVGGIGPKVPGSRGEMHISFRRLQDSLPEEASAAAAAAAAASGSASESSAAAGNAGTTITATGAMASGKNDATESKPAPTVAGGDGGAAAASSGDGTNGRERSLPFPSPSAPPAVPTSGAMPPHLPSPSRNGSGSSSPLSGPTSPMPPNSSSVLSPESPGTSFDKDNSAAAESAQGEVVHYGDSDVLLDVVS